MTPVASPSGKRSLPSTLTLDLLLGTLTAVTPLSVDMYLPALPRIAEDLGSTPSTLQLTLASCFAGLALGQLLTGPLIDRLGRTRPLYAGLALYVLASLGCALSPNASALVALRFVQALGGGVALVVPRAVVRDLWSGAEAAKAMSRLLLVMGVAPILAPLLGGFVLGHLGWRAIFVILAGIGALALVAAVRVLPETAPPRDASRSAAAQLAAVVRDRNFLGPALSGGFSQAGMFAYIAGAPFIFISLHGVAPEDFGWFFGTNAVGLIGMAQLNRKLVELMPLRRLLRLALTLSVLAAAGVLGVTWSGALGLWGIAPALFLFVSALGVVFPNAVAIALEHHASRAGLASAVLGAFQFVAAAVASWAVSTFNDGTARPMGAVVLATAVLAWISGVLGSREPAPDTKVGQGGAGESASVPGVGAERTG